MKTVKKALSAQISGPGLPDGLESTITLKTFLNFEIPITMYGQLRKHNIIMFILETCNLSVYIVHQLPCQYSSPALGF